MPDRNLWGAQDEYPARDLPGGRHLAVAPLVDVTSVLGSEASPGRCRPRSRRRGAPHEPRRRRVRHVLRPAGRARIRSTLRVWSHGTCLESSRSFMISSRAPKDRPDVDVRGRGLGCAGYPARLGKRLRGAQQRFGGHTRIERALTADEVGLDDRHVLAFLGQTPGEHRRPVQLRGRSHRRSCGPRDLRSRMRHVASR